jgi:hypothetical protein
MERRKKRRRRRRWEEEHRKGEREEEEATRRPHSRNAPARRAARREEGRCGTLRMSHAVIVVFSARPRSTRSSWKRLNSHDGCNQPAAGTADPGGANTLLDESIANVAVPARGPPLVPAAGGLPAGSRRGEEPRTESRPCTRAHKARACS